MRIDHLFSDQRTVTLPVPADRRDGRAHEAA
jgi:hypothetical protein